MRNLKRALSLALASVMLLGMMVVGSSAASNFADADEIVNTEAVEITAGLGLFAGTTDGKFDPKGNVTRAQMATIIVKMLYGSEINADQFKGVDKFSDVANFEGGWAEGYINLCANLKIVGGYGDGTFKPGNSVTTAEAVTMIINALKVDAGAGTWPLTVMSKAEEMKLFAELAVKPGTNEALTRDQLASVVLEGIKYSPKGVTGYTIPGSSIVFSDLGDAVIANGNTAVGIQEVVGEDALWNSVFEVKSVQGIVVANQATEHDAEATRVELPTTANMEFDLETGLDKIGQLVTVYYKEEYTNEKDPGLTYCMVEEGTTVVLTENITAGETNQAKQFRAAFGTKAINTVGAISFANYVKEAATDLGIFNSTSQTANKGTYVIDEDNNLVSYIKNVSPVVTTVTKINTTAGKESISLSGVGALKNNADEDVVVEYEGIAQDDIVTYTKAGDIYTLAPTTAVEGKLAKKSTTKIDSITYDVLTVAGKDYIVYTNSLITGILDNNASALTNFNNTYKFYVAANGKIVGWETVSGQADLTNVVYVVDVYEVSSTDATYGNVSNKLYAQCIDMDGKEVTYLLAVGDDATDMDGDGNTTNDVLYDDTALTNMGLTYTVGTSVTGFTPGFYSFEKSNINKAANLGIMIPTVVASAYDKVSAPLYQKTTTMIGQSLTGKSTHILTTEGTAYLTANTKFLVYDGSKTTLATALTVGSITHSFTADVPVLLTRNTDGNKVVEVVVINKDPDSVVTGDYIYVSAVSAANKVSTTDLGDVYEAYNAKGEVIEITVTKGYSMVAGFYQFATDADGVTDLTSIAAATDVKMNELFDTVYNNELVTGGIDHYDLTDAIIIDARDEDLIEGSDVYKIETVADLVSLKSIDDAEITMDVYVDSGDEAVEIIFITKVVALYTPDDGEQLTFIRAATVDGETVVWATKNDTTAEEVKVEVDMTLVAALALTGTITYDAANNKF